MARNAIVRLCTLLVLVLLVSAATSGWAQSGTGSSSDKKGAMCGGIAGLRCPEGQACRYPVNMCNVADLAGTCVKVKSPCPTGGSQVCGCDGTTYANECELLTAGAREAYKGACKKPA
ncbi:MAG TPA: Kazal-type serine protease inhibitor domain-containing protein [Thermoanaerobaculia bacterium]|jgi:hypothetical protein|nr:Kazal-type serine protease inhibitor domain-containing protein [Thermoanaerobaculia bacterium]